jgi:small neutral amino acid transporter SnatA (MarC family)
MGNEVFYILGGLLLVYFAITLFNKKQSKRRKSRSFMDGRKLRDRKDTDT